jgi:hypothetical protein
VGWLQKNEEKNKKQKNSSPSASLPRVLGWGTRGRGLLPRVLGWGTRVLGSSPSAFLPRVQYSKKSFFPECPIFGSRGSPRHSGNFRSPVVNTRLHWNDQTIVHERACGLRNELQMVTESAADFP